MQNVSDLLIRSNMLKLLKSSEVVGRNKLNRVKEEPLASNKDLDESKIEYLDEEKVQSLKNLYVVKKKKRKKYNNNYLVYDSGIPTSKMQKISEDRETGKFILLRYSN